ncbi:YceI family protein [Flavivirga amylovorans]|uniref:YceI family protein n=1 Tax=Flavivirga amylovorans TaxID=870486 RepID=A0ABT8WYD9_9FLAO|nr:YceI family protein [Flavivirga amylovorans]MDO5986715.1 YceI family protein [Flavivirga amylovorans]
MKKIVFFNSIMLMLAFTNKDIVKDNTSVLIAPESELMVKGKTNINTFKCYFDVQKLKDPIPVFFETRGRKMIFEKTKLILENTCFDCGSRGINKDFQKVLNSKAHPQIILELKALERLNGEDAVVKATLDLEIAGTIKSYKFPVELKGKKNVFVKGVLILNIRDFNIDPPEKLLGIIAVEETIEISFQLLIKEFVVCHDKN